MRFATVLMGLALLSACEDRESSSAIFHPAGQRMLLHSDVAAADLNVGGEVYIPVYSSVHWGKSGNVTEISATLSIRNVDAERELILTHVDYYDSHGKLIRRYLDRPAGLAPMATVEWMIEVHDTEGGSGANFMVGWGAPEAIARPVMEAIMLAGSRGISFVSAGRPVEVVENATDPGESPD